MKLRLALLLFVCPAAGAVAAGVDTSKLPPPITRPVDFAQDIQPLFQKYCVKCHGPDKQKSGYRVDRKESALHGGDDHAPNIVPGDSAGSPLIQFVAGLDEDMIMPQKGERLTAEQIGLLRAWIDQGANWPADAQAPKKSHWAYEPVRQPAVPNLAGTKATVRNPIDAFILAKLGEHGLDLSPEADRATLIRRLSFDLLGLPPAPEQIASFVADPDPQAYEKLVDRLLASPHYGERWARHWLDVVRFAESNGFETNLARAHAWPYRDYVIRAFNEDMPYDRFVREQLAGDALGADEATGFIVGGAYDIVKSPDPVLTAQQRADELHDMVSTTGSAFLGLTVGCARCHNHKFDPVSQVDYYSMTAIFQGVMHGERPSRPPNYAEDLAKAAPLQKELEPLNLELARYRTTAGAGRVLLLDDSAPPSGPTEPGVTSIEQPANGEPISYSPGKERGQLDDPGDGVRFPNLGRSYRYWNSTKGKREDFFSWEPRATGRFRIWISWGVERTYARDARYVLDVDGHSGSAPRESEIARADQSKFADGAPAVGSERRWSGFYNAGIHELQPGSRVVLCSGEEGGPVAADAVCFEEVLADAPADAPAVPRLRAPISNFANEELFPAVEAKFLRMTITASSSAEPCIDELEAFTAGSNPRNVALASAGTRATASSVYGNGSNPKHQLAHLNDGRYGNSFSWISNEKGAGWVKLEFARPERIDRVVWSRDRGPTNRVLDDRLPTAYRIEVSSDGEVWRTVASSVDRLPVALRKQISSIPTLSDVRPEERARVAELAGRRHKLEDEIERLTKFPGIYAGKFEQPGPTYRLYRGDPMQPKEKVVPAAITELGGSLGLAADAPEQERRVALANWIVNPNNPLAARVFVNRLWHYHFGTGIVDTPSDFGLNGGRPSHPELLDWLASEFMARGWSVKQMQRLMVLSATYRQSSAPQAKALQVDAGARLLWRFPPQRLEAEALRDTILAVSGKLNPSMGGPGFDLFQPNNNYVKVYTARQEFGPDEFRRMIYQAKPRVQLDDVFGAFDCPDAGQIAPRRTSSTTPLQALNLLNSAFAMQQAGYFAARLETEAGSDVAAEVNRAFLLAFGRAPSSDELSAASTLIHQSGLKIFCRALFNANEFISLF